MFFVSLRLELQMPDQIEPSLPDLIETVTCPSESDSPTHLVAEVDEDDGDVLGDEREEKNEDDGEADEEQDGQHQYDDDAVSLDMADEEIAVVSDEDDAEGDGGGDGGGDDGDDDAEGDDGDGDDGDDDDWFIDEDDEEEVEDEDHDGFGEGYDESEWN